MSERIELACESCGAPTFVIVSDEGEAARYWADGVIAVFCQSCGLPPSEQVVKESTP